MNDFWSAAEFLDLLNNKIERKNGQRVEFSEPVDLIVHGPCGYEAERTDCGWLHPLAQKLGARRVMIFPRCCSPFPESYKARLREKAPDVFILFPQVPNLADHFILAGSINQRLASALTEDGILRPIR